MDLPEFDALPRAPEAVSVMPAGFSWAPGTRPLLVFNTRPTFEGPGLMLNNDLWFADIDEGELQQVYPPGAGGQFHFSPDGSQIALVLPDSISLVNTDGSNRRDRVFVYPEVVTYSEYAFYAKPEWADDSSYLMAVIPPQAALDRPEDPSTIWRIPQDGSPAVLQGSFHAAPLFTPNLSPDLQRVVYLQQSGESADNVRSLHISNVDGSDDQVYTEAENLMLNSWAPDSLRFVFTLGETAQLMIGETGREARPADSLSAVTDLRWVDAERFLYITRSGGNADLRLWSINGEDVLVDRFAEGSGSFLSYDFVGQ
jgi:Tol biopolymer transport system component